PGWYGSHFIGSVLATGEHRFATTGTVRPFVGFAAGVYASMPFPRRATRYAARATRWAGSSGSRRPSVWTWGRVRIEPDERAAVGLVSPGLHHDVDRLFVRRLIPYPAGVARAKDFDLATALAT